jgi:hypothetical protein
MEVAGTEEHRTPGERAAGQRRSDEDEREDGCDEQEPLARRAAPTPGTAEGDERNEIVVWQSEWVLLRVSRGETRSAARRGSESRS